MDQASTDRLEHLGGILAELDDDIKRCREASSWVALERLLKLKIKVYDEVTALRAELDDGSDGADFDADAIAAQVVEAIEALPLHLLSGPAEALRRRLGAPELRVVS